MKIVIVSIGGTPLAYGNVYNGSPRFSNFVAEHLCGYLRKNDNSIIDILYFQETDNILEIYKILNNYEIIFFALDFVNFNIAKKYIKKFKKKQIITILFGHLVSSYYIEIINEIKPNYIILGDPEEPSLRLLKSIKKNQNIFNDQNIVTLNDFNSKSKNICLDLDNYPCFDYYKNNSFEENQNKTHCISLKNQVCMCNCSFCWSNKGKYKYKKVKNILDEMNYVAIEYGIKDFYFTDNDILDYRNESEFNIIDELFTGIIDLKLNISIFVFAKSRNINEKNIPLLKKMKQAGVYCIFIGIDSGNNEDLKLYRKSSNLDNAYNAIRIFKKLGIWYRIGLIGVNPYSTLNRLKENYVFLTNIRSTNYYNYGGMKVMIFKNTPLYFKVLEDNLLLEKNYNFKSFYSYTFKNKEIIPYVKFIQDILLSKIEYKNFIPYFALRKNYEKTKVVSKINEDKIIEDIENKLFDVINNYFKILFIDNDLKQAKKQMDNFINNLLDINKNNRDLMKKYNEIYSLTKVKRE